jgi:hypothetical protein
MTSTSTTLPTDQPSVDVDIRPSDPELDHGEPVVAHIVRKDKGSDIAAIILEARITGTPLEALCGAIFVPQRDPRRVPPCDKCREIYDLYRGVNDKLPEDPPAE